MKAVGWLARATHKNLIRHNIYSITLVPQKLGLHVANDGKVPADRTQEEIMQTSFLTLGGWDWEDYSGNITWFDAVDTWNQTLTGLKIDDTDIIRDYDNVNVQFEIGYPYIGLSDKYWNDVSDYLKRSVTGMECVSG